MAKIKTLTVLSATALAVAAALVVQAPGSNAVGKTSCEFIFVTGSPYVCRCGPKGFRRVAVLMRSRTA